MKKTAFVAMIFVVAIFAPACNNYDWSKGKWGIVVSGRGTPNSVNVGVWLNGGIKIKTGNALEVYYKFSSVDIPSLWVFLTDGYWRQAAHNNHFFTSGRSFQYFTDNDLRCDPIATQMTILGINEKGELLIEFEYESFCGDNKFIISNIFYLREPNNDSTSMRVETTITNVSGKDVIPYWDGHLLFGEQWVLFAISSMYVADNLTPIPDWYKNWEIVNNDPSDYLGLINDQNYLNDGFSQNGGIYVSTHDTALISGENFNVRLNHEMPNFLIDNYEWYKDLILLDEISSEIQLEHLYNKGRNHYVKLLKCSGISSRLENLTWSAIYNRDDENFVDGDNIMVRLGLDNYLSAWPNGAYQSIEFEYVSGKVK